MHRMHHCRWAVGGDDTILGGLGNDTIIGGIASGDGEPDDSVEGGGGNDLIRGTRFADGGTGDDTIIGSAGDAFTIAHAGDGNDFISATFARGGDGNDTIIGINRIYGSQDLSGGNGDDFIDASMVPFIGARLNGDGGNDIISGGYYFILEDNYPEYDPATLNGGDGNDVLDGRTPFVNQLIPYGSLYDGGAGDDIIYISEYQLDFGVVVRETTLFMAQEIIPRP